MKITLLSYKIASWSLITVGIGHTITYLTSPSSIKRDEVILKMKEFTAQISGSEISIFSFHEGFSLMMGLLLFGYGMLNLFVSKNNKEAYLPSNIMILNILISMVSLILSIKYFFIVPIVFTGVSLLGFSISMGTKKV